MIPRPSLQTPEAEDSGSWPANLSEEKGALGAAVLGRAVEVVQLFTVDCFSTSANVQIFRAIGTIVAAGEADGPLEIAQIVTVLSRHGTLEACGGWAYLCDLTTGVRPARPLQSRLEILREMASRRKLLRISFELEARAVDLTQPTAETLSWLQAEALR